MGSPQYFCRFIFIFWLSIANYYLYYLLSICRISDQKFKCSWLSIFDRLYCNYNVSFFRKTLCLLVCVYITLLCFGERNKTETGVNLMFSITGCLIIKKCIIRLPMQNQILVTAKDCSNHALKITLNPLLTL
jgi:hypothetical protein